MTANWRPIRAARLADGCIIALGSHRGRLTLAATMPTADRCEVLGGPPVRLLAIYGAARRQDRWLP